MSKNQEKLFDDTDRNFMGPRDFAESAFIYINRTARPEFSYLRGVLEEWYAEYDADDQKRRRLRRNFRSRYEEEHYSAFFELYLHKLLSSLGYNIQIEPEWPVGSPDFLVSTQTGEKFLVEATTVYPQRWFGPHKKREQRLLDYINHNLQVFDFILLIKILNRSDNNPPLKEIVNFVRHEIDKFDADEVINHRITQPDFGLRDLPSFIWHSEGWRIEFTLSPKKPEARGKLDALPIGMINYGVSSANSAEHIKSRIDSKYGHYGVLDIPYILAMNVLDSFADDYDYSIALFGEEYFEFPTGESGRHPNGAWYGPNGFQKKRMSGILFYRNLFPWNMDNKSPVLWHHPYANYPLDPDLWMLSQQVPMDGRFKLIEGANINELLEIDLSQMPR